MRSLLTVSEVWGETGWKSFSGDCVRRHQKSLRVIRLRSCLRAIRLPRERRGIRRRWARLALAGENRSPRHPAAHHDILRNHRYSARSALVGQNRSLRRAALQQAAAY